MFVVLRVLLCLHFFGHPVTWLFGVSELAVCASTVWAVRRGCVDDSWQGRIVPLVYLLPLLMSSHGAYSGHLWAAFLWLAIVVELSFRFWLGRYCTIGVPVAVGLRTSGPYRFIRHPLSAVEVVAIVALLGCFPSVWNMGVAVLAVAGQALNVLIEERHWRSAVFHPVDRPRDSYRCAASSEYASYSVLVPWRWLPGVW